MEIVKTLIALPILLLVFPFAACSQSASSSPQPPKAIKAHSPNSQRVTNDGDLLANDKMIKFEAGDVLHVRLLSGGQLFEVLDGNRVRVKKPLYLWNTPTGVLLSEDGVSFARPSLQAFPRGSVAFAPKKKLNLFFIWLDPWVAEQDYKSEKKHSNGR